MGLSPEGFPEEVSDQGLSPRDRAVRGGGRQGAGSSEAGPWVGSLRPLLQRHPPPARDAGAAGAVSGGWSPRRAVQSVPDASFSSTLLVSFSWRRTDSRGTPSRGTAPCDDWRPPCSPPPRWRRSTTLTPAAAAPPRAPPVPSFSAAARPRAAPCVLPTGATRPWPPATTDSCPRCSASRGPSCSRCGRGSPTRPRLGAPPSWRGQVGGAGSRQRPWFLPRTQ